MPRYRQIPTGVRSERDIERALTEMGLKGVEVHDTPQPLMDWIGRPTSVLATVIVRRKNLGASADDVGFARNENGTFDLIVSEIHLFRFDKRWLADLARRTGTEPADAGPIQFAASVPGPALKPPALSSATARSSSAAANVFTSAPKGTSPSGGGTARDANAGTRARIESTEILERTKKSQSLGTIGCLLFFLPVLPSFLIAVSPNHTLAARNLIAMWVVWTVVYLFVISIVLAVRFQRRAREFMQRFPQGSEARTAAIAHLRSIAKDQKHAAAKTAERLLRQVETDALSALTQRLPKPPRGPGATGR